MVPDGVKYIEQLPPLPERPANAHKGTFGHALIVAGSRGMSGAAVLAGQAALHGGAGLVTLAVPHSIADIVAAAHPSYMTRSMAEDDDGRFAQRAWESIAAHLQSYSSVAIGPGLGQSDEIRTGVLDAYHACPQPLVIDADALNVISPAAVSLSDTPAAPRVLTPHPGEFARLVDSSLADIQSQRDEVAVAFAERHGVILLLKGPSTVITDGARLARNATGGAELATGGSGDVLTGLITALLAQGMNAFDAAHLGAHIHGLAGEAAAERWSPRYVTSLEIVRSLDFAWKKLESIESP